MAPRANWKGYLRLSLVSCPVALYPATSEQEKVRFHQVNKSTGNRIRMQRIDAGTGETVDYGDIVKGYQVSKDQSIEITDEDLEAVEIETSHTIDIDQFVPREEIDQIYNVRPYYLVPEGDVGQQAFAVIREAIRKEGLVALARVVLTSREHVIALEPRGKGLVGTLLRYPYEVREEADYFDDIPDEKIPKDMLDLAVHIVRGKKGHFDPKTFEDRYETALRELIEKKAAGQTVKAPEHREPAKVINLMDALKRSLKAESGGRAAPERAPARKSASAKGRSAKASAAKESAKTASRKRKAG